LGVVNTLVLPAIAYAVICIVIEEGKERGNQGYQLDGYKIFFRREPIAIHY